MFPTPSKVTRLWLLPAVALVLMLLVYAVFAVNAAQAQTPAGDYCVEGIVISWEEKPLAGWEITLEGPNGLITTTVSAPKPDEDDNDPEFRKGEFEFQDLALFGAGIYTATITPQPGWEGVSPETDENGVTAQSFTIEVGEKDCVRIRFKMRPIIPVIVRKIDVNHVGLQDWKIKVVPGPGNLFASPEEEKTDIDGNAFFTLTPGLWIFMEMPPKADEGDPQEAYMPVVPPSGRQEIFFKDDDNLTYLEAPLLVTFKNELTVGCIIARKISDLPPGETGAQAVGTFNVAGWGFKLLRKDGTVAREGVTDAKGEVLFDGLPLGPYILVEEDRPGWNATSIEEWDISSAALVTAGTDCVRQDFTNQQDENAFCIEGRKVDANGWYGLKGWEMSIESLSKGGFVPDPDEALTDGLGEFRFDFPKNDYRIPGAEYEICEEVKDGWLPHTDTCQTVRLPEWPGACVQLKDFVNQQVGHSESEKDGHGGPDGRDGGPDGRDNGRGGMDGGKGNSCSTFHEVKPGEGLYDIGRMYKKSPQQMLDANPDIRKSPHQWVIIGQKVCIP